MRRCGLRFSLAVRFALPVLAAVTLVSLAANNMIGREFEEYVKEQQQREARDIAQNISSQYSAGAGGWNLDYIHGMGMYALEAGFVIKLYDEQGAVLWDAEHHDMTLCHEVMQSISLRMEEERPDLDGDFVTCRYDLQQAGRAIGALDISYYSPYYMDENAFQFLGALNRILLAAGAVSLAGAVAMGLLLADHLARPLSRVVEITKEISDGGYRARCREDTRIKELHELTLAVNQMAGSLEEQEALRRRLTSDVAHELRTPVANLSATIEMMSDGVMEPTPERLQACYAELQRLSRLISELERLRQEESGNLTLDRSEADLRELALAVIGTFETQLREKHLEGQVTGSACIVPIDSGRIQQVITNLVSNAIKYSNDGGMVRIDVKDTEDSGVLSVEDSGIGIPQGDLRRIFERFYRTDKSRDRKTGGAGIGLTISKAIVQAHGGTITAQSEEGRGSRLTVTLPKTISR